ncbi:hypothetical protein [Nocardioides aquiterrae]|uniref:Uncharacterized protein n=1 Tax=Nocardioides aquiterrae TaxID=203799 RepID=A0ABN1UVK6_9ACTN
MNFTQRLGGGVRKAARTTRAVVRDLAGEAADAVYARVLDGEHLWVAVPAGAGRPALQDPATGELTEAEPLPDEDPAYASARWRLTDVLPETEDAEALLVAVGDKAKPAALRLAVAPADSHLRTPPTPDGRWRFLVVTDDAGFLRVRRTRAARVARLLAITSAGGSVQLRLSPPEAGLEPRLHFVRKDGTVAHSVVAVTDGDDVVATLGAADVPAPQGGYRIAVGPADDPVTVARLTNDLTVVEASAVLLPFLLDPETDMVAGRFVFSDQGVLRFARKVSTIGETA